MLRGKPELLNEPELYKSLKCWTNSEEAPELTEALSVTTGKEAKLLVLNRMSGKLRYSSWSVACCLLYVL